MMHAFVHAFADLAELVGYGAACLAHHREPVLLAIYACLLLAVLLRILERSLARKAQLKRDRSTGSH